MPGRRRGGGRADEGVRGASRRWDGRGRRGGARPDDRASPSWLASPRRRAGGLGGAPRRAAGPRYEGLGAVGGRGGFPEEPRDERLEPAPRLRGAEPAFGIDDEDGGDAADPPGLGEVVFRRAGPDPAVVVARLVVLGP